MDKKKLLKSVLMAIAVTILVILVLLLVLWALICHPFWSMGAIVIGIIYGLAREIYNNIL
jgi:hypothetical protein